jgi:hypothetical protein
MGAAGDLGVQKGGNPMSVWERIAGFGFTALVAASLTPSQSAAAVVAANTVTLERVYQPGQTLQYEMAGSNHGWNYQIHAESVAKQDSESVWFEEFAWSNLRSNAPLEMSADSKAFRQKLSLSGEQKYLSVPDLSKVQPLLIGPITDTLNFYADLFLAKKLGLTRVGQNAYFERGIPNSWADGTQVLVGEDVIDFDLTLLGANPKAHTAELLVKHIPPKQQRLKLPASWMQTPVRTLPNNWVQVIKSDGGFVAQVGTEVFEVLITVDTRDGKIVEAKIHNPVVYVERTCIDAALTQCTEPKPDELVRDVSLVVSR